MDSSSSPSMASCGILWHPVVNRHEDVAGCVGATVYKSSGSAHDKKAQVLGGSYRRSPSITELPRYDMIQAEQYLHCY